MFRTTADGKWTMEVSFRSTDPDRAQVECCRAYYPLTLEVLGHRPAFRMSMAMVSSGPVTLGDIRFDADVRLSCGELASAYHVNIPLSGALASEHRGEAVVATPRTAAIYHPTGDTVLRRWPGTCRQLCLKLERAAVETELDALLGAAPRRPVELAPTLDLDTGPGRSWAALVRLLAAEVDGAGGLLTSSAAGAHLGRALVSGLLLAVPHTYSEQLHDHVGPCRPRTVKRVTDAIEADPAADHTVSDLARIAGVGVRALQAGFAAHVGLSPTAYLRSVRLARAHDDLVAGTPDELTVHDAARHWGFGHPGRFAEAYRRAYGRSPSATLRASTPRAGGRRQPAANRHLP